MNLKPTSEKILPPKVTEAAELRRKDRDIEEIEAIAKIIVDFINDEKMNPVLAYQAPSLLRSELDLAIPEQGKGIAQVFALLQQVVRATPKTASKGFFNQLFGGRTLPATAADMLAPVLNNSMYTFKVAGVHVLIEQEVIENFCRLVGYKNAEGTFTPGGSLANLVAMILARNEKQSPVRNRGFDGRTYTAYTSDQGHYSIRKNAGIIGVGRDHVREIPSDKSGKMKPGDLRRKIVADLQDACVPFFINATAGTTVLGSFDPIAEIAKIAEEFGIWLHVDGAWGGSLLLSRKHKHLLAGCEGADSFAWNAHKMMGVPLSASAILLKKKGLLEKHFSEQADYLFQNDNAFNPGTKSIQCGRRNDALKVWLAWQALGQHGFAKRIDTLYDLAQYAAAKVERDHALRLCMAPESMNVCFQVVGKSSERICEMLDKRGMLKVGYGHFRGESYIRLVCVNPDLTFADIDAFFQKVKDVSA